MANLAPSCGKGITLITVQTACIIPQTIYLGFKEASNAFRTVVGAFHLSLSTKLTFPKDVLLAAMIMPGSCYDTSVIGHDAHGDADVAGLLAELIRGWKEGMTRDVGNPLAWPTIGF